MPAKLYKIVSTEFEPIHGGSGLWFPPTKTKPSKWMPKVEDVCACSSGYHLIPAKAIVEWLPRAPITGYLCEAEGRGASDKDGNKVAFAQARLVKVVGVLDEVSMRLAAADMAERVLPIFYEARPKDHRPARAIQAAREFAHGKIDAVAADAAARAADAAARAARAAAARAAATAAAWAAAADAADAADAAAAWAAATAAAGAAAWAAAWAAARAVAGDAAGAVAGDAAGAAARAAAWAAVWAENARIIIAQAKKRRAALSKAEGK